jgi:signal transduction histidine kinase
MPYYQMASQLPLKPGNLFAMLADKLLLFFFPASGVMLVLTLMALVVVLPPSAIFSFLFARQTTRRLVKLAAAATALRSGDYGARVSVTGEDEVAQLQADFNAMADKLEGTLRDLQSERDTVGRLLQSRRELIANVSHELRTPVATVRALLDSALERGTDAPPALQHDLQVMQGEVTRLQGLIDDLFTLSRAETGALALDCRTTDVGSVVKRMVEAIKPLAWQSGRVEVVADIPQDLPAACVDAERLEQMLANLLRNGVRHTPPGGIVAAIACAETEYVVIEVRDTGPGIAPDDLPHIWERFYRGQNSDGAGLGLAIVKELIEAMGGSVSVESTVGQGSRFTVRLRRA